MKKNKVNRLSQVICLLFVLGIVLPVFAKSTIGDLVGPSLFIHTELIEEPDPSMEELESLVDELEVQFDLLMVEVFKGYTEVYLPNIEQHSELSSDEFDALVKERRALLDKWCTPGIDDENNLFSLECRDDDLSPLKIGFGHPVYNNLIISINRHSLLTNLKDGENRLGTKVHIIQKGNLYRLGGNHLMIGTHTREKEALGVQVLVHQPEVSNLYCRILSFSPFTIDNYWPAHECAIALRESVAVLKRLNRDL